MSNKNLSRIAVLAALLILSGISNGFMDSLQFHYSESLANRKGWNPEYWNPDHSWRFKYARTNENTLVAAPDSWYYRAFDLKYKERFPLSATALVWTTDAWHLLKTVSWGSIRLALVFVFVTLFYAAYPETRWKRIWPYLIGWVGLTLIQSVGFHLTYSWL